jgi:branched-chain amino acid transport system substrate-binding protein
LPDTAAQLVDQFNDKDIKLILGPYGSATTEAAAAVVERNGQVMADSSGADDKIFSKGYQRTFAVLSPATEYASSIVRAVVEMATPKPTTVAFLSADDGFSKTVTRGGIAEANKQGLRVVATEYFPAGATDVSSAITKVKGLRPDLVIGSVHLAEGIAIIKQSNELGFKPSGGFGETVAPPTPDFAQALGPLANGVLGSTQWTSTVAGSEPLFGSARDYAATFQQMFHKPPEYHGAEATAACLALALAVDKAGSTDPTKVRNALASLDTPSFFGPIKFDSTGKNVTKKMGVIQIQNGAVVSVWPRVGQQKPMTWPGVR